MVRVWLDGLPVRRHATATVTLAAIRRLRTQVGAATRAGFEDEDLSA